MQYDCEHQKYLVTDTDIISADKDGKKIYIAAVTISCRNCGAEFRFKAPKEEMCLDYPTVSPDGLQIRLPIEPDDRNVLLRSTPKEN